jgi:hypothetical protein
VGDLSDLGNPLTATQFNSLDIAGMLVGRVYPTPSNDPTFKWPSEFTNPTELAGRVQDFDLSQRTMHNRLITVGISKDFPMGASQRKNWSEFIFKTWAIYWKEFGGFPYGSYTVVLGSKNLPYADRGASGLGIVVSSARTDWTAHEIYHAWAGNSFRQAEERSWYMEGVTTYYGNIRQQSEYPYQSIMRSFVKNYLDYYKSGKDRPLGEMKMYTPEYDHTFTAQKGAVVAYVLDSELRKHGHHIGEVSRFIYQRHGIKSQGMPTNDQFLAAFNEVSGGDFADFFGRYIYGTERLPVSESNTFDWICHE